MSTSLGTGEGVPGGDASSSATEASQLTTAVRSNHENNRRLDVHRGVAERRQDLMAS